MDKQEYWALSLDDLTEEIWSTREWHSEVGSSHHIGYAGTRDEVLAKFMANFGLFAHRMMYQAKAYGTPKQDGDDDED